MNWGNNWNSLPNLKLAASSFLNSANLETNFINILSNHLITSIGSSENVLKIAYLDKTTAAAS